MKKIKLIIENYKRKFVHLISKAKSKLVLFHNSLLELDVNNLPTPGKKNPYTALSEWIIDVFQYGLLISLIYFPIVNNVTSLLPLSFGVGHWFVFDTLSKVKDKLKDNK